MAGALNAASKPTGSQALVRFDTKIEMLLLGHHAKQGSPHGMLTP
ncbi:hypothetical protein BCO37747_06528 [Burkholderia contaminans]|jgi:hypothetical protein|nr:hypothetical protein SK875_C00242 [Burkholderia contaminans]VWC39533.1 hypothetical protein BCO23253_07000 [Burkholderia contaminans]VWD54794.1 hypothetical protein BCO37747_06528 [Burkholderia contaminans]